MKTAHHGSEIIHSSSTLAVLALLLALPICIAQSVSIGQSVQVSAANSQLNHYEVIVAADPTNAKRLLACSMIDPAQPSRDLNRNIAYRSLDGGLTWSPSLEIAGGIWSADPSCAFGGDGDVFFAALVFDSVKGKYKGRTVLYKSQDAAKTWSLGFTFPEEGDREFLTVDSQNRRIYMVEKYIGRSLQGATAIPVIMYESSDGAASFQARAILPTPDLYPLPGHPGGILSDGTFATSISDFAPDYEEARVSGSGASLGKLTVLLYNQNKNDDLSLSFVDNIHKCNGRIDGLALSSLAVDSSTGVFRDRIYVVWPDSRSGRCEILFSFSSDRGKTWSRAIRINDDRPRGTNAGPDDFQPVVAVNRERIVGVLWYDRRDSGENLQWAPRFSASLDGGQTFLHSTAFAGAGMRFFPDRDTQLVARGYGGGNLPSRRGGVIQTTVGYLGPAALLGGETAGLAADTSGAFHALWVDNRSGTRQVWTAPIIVRGHVTKNGSKDLAVLEDITDDVAVLFSAVRLDRANQTVTANAYVQNTSASTLINPIKLKMLRLDSAIGIPEFTNADNGRRDSGAVFDFSSVVNEGMLKPGESSTAKQIIIHFNHLALGLSVGNYDVLQRAVAFDAMVFGKHDSTALSLSTAYHHYSKSH